MIVFTILFDALALAVAGQKLISLDTLIIAMALSLIAKTILYVRK